jgi:hypothetical protein
MPPNRTDWANAYARQSRSDFTVFEAFPTAMPDGELCHRLRYLQMACEKIAKAYRFRDTSTPMEVLLTSHVAFFKCIENVLRSPEIKRRYNSRSAELRRLLGRAGSVAREIERLAPAVDRDHSPQNTEYPWEDGDNVVLPCQYSYPNLDMLFSVKSFPFVGGRDILTLIRTMIYDFDTIRLA